MEKSRLTWNSYFRVWFVSPKRPWLITHQDMIAKRICARLNYLNCLKDQPCK